MHGHGWATCPNRTDDALQLGRSLQGVKAEVQRQDVDQLTVFLGRMVHAKP